MIDSTTLSSLEKLAARKSAAFLGIPLIKSIIEQLETELPQRLSFHSAQHAKDVLHEAVLFGTVDGLSESDVELLALAAAYHDSGFLFCDEKNESRGAELARTAMRASSSYSLEQVDLVSQMILDTQVVFNLESAPQRPQTALSPYLLDADLSNLGREDFFEKLDLLIAERRMTPLEGMTQGLELMERHEWQTKAASILRQEQKRKNFIRLRTAITELNPN